MIVVLLATLVTCSVTASAASYDWTTTPTSPYVYYPFSGSIQNDNVNYSFGVTEPPLSYGNVPFQTFTYDSDGYLEGYRVNASVEGSVRLHFSAFSTPVVGSQYPESLPTISIDGVTPSLVLHEITYTFAEYTSSGALSVSPYTYTYLIELPEFDVAEAYARFCGDESPVFPPDDIAVVVTSITTTFDADGEITIRYRYPKASDTFDGFSNIHLDPPNVDVDSIIEQAYQAGVQDGFDEGFDQGLEYVNEFNPGQWLLNIVQGLFACVILPIGSGITVGMLLAVLLVIPFAIWLLRLFAGG